MPDAIDVGIDGVRLFPLTPHPDSRGSFTEVYRREWIPGGREMPQANLSLSYQNVLRGMHFHRQQADYWVVIKGVAFIALYDLRSGSPTEGKKAEFSVDAGEERRGLYIPRGVAHGFHAQTDIELQYLVDEYFTGEDEFGVAWDDPEMGIEWPSREPILSDRDRSNPSLQEVRSDRPPYP
ncbi:MAG TPA: dTDP-4-dehydrorhamnose 3,5-epimerase family protein [Actinomycetota bacterium]